MSPNQTEPNELIVRSTGQGRFSQELIVGKHVLKADEPVASGGNDTGPSPYDFLLAAIGSCTSMTLKLYAEIKKIPLDNVIVTLKHYKTYAADCTNCEKGTAKIDHIDRRIELIGALDQEQREKLLAIANKCPVHQTLTSQIDITTELVDSKEHLGS